MTGSTSQKIINGLESINNPLLDALRQKKQNVTCFFRIFIGRMPTNKELVLHVGQPFARLAETIIKSPECASETIGPLVKRKFMRETSGTLPQDLKNWAVERLVSENSRLMVLTATDFEGFLLALLTDEDGYLSAHLSDGQMQGLKARKQAWILEDPIRSSPFFMQYPSIADVEKSFLFFLGRSANKHDDLEARRLTGFQNLVSRLVQSTEAQKRFMNLILGKSIEHDRHRDRREDVLDCMVSHFPFSDKTLEQLEGQTDWRSSLMTMWADSEFVSFVMGLLPPDLDENGVFAQEIIQSYQTSLGAEETTVLAVDLHKMVFSGSIKVENVVDLMEDPVLLDENGQAIDLVSYKLEPAVGRSDIWNFELNLEPVNFLKEKALPSNLQLKVNGSDIITLSSKLRARPTLDAVAEEAKAQWFLSKGDAPHAEALGVSLRFASEEDVADRVLYESALMSGRLENALEGLKLGDSEWSKNAYSLHQAHANNEEAFPSDLAGSHALLQDWSKHKLPRPRLVDFVDAQLESEKDTLDGIVERLIILREGLAPDEQIIQALQPLELWGRSRFRQFHGALKKLLCSDVVIRAVAGMDPMIALKLEMATGAMKYAEGLGNYKQCLEIGRVQYASYKQPKLDQIVLMATVENKYGDLDQAINLFEKAMSKAPRNQSLRRQWLNFRRSSAISNPLAMDYRFKDEAETLVNARMDALMRSPNNSLIREELADALFIKGDEAAAFEVLNQLYEVDEISENASKRLIDLAVRRKQNELAITLTEALPVSERSQWVLVNYIRALRALGRADDAQVTLNEFAVNDTPVLLREKVRNHFFLEEFEKAKEVGEELCKTHGEDVELRIVVAAAYLETNNVDGAEKHIEIALENPKFDRFVDELDLFRYTVAHKRNENTAINALRPMFHRLGVAAVTTVSDQKSGFDDFIIDENDVRPEVDNYAPVFDGPLVSIIMTSYNSEEYIDTAIRSIMEQTYANIELIVVDDLSTDSTRRKLMEWEQKDSRVRTVLKSDNSGTYVSKNMGLLQARGEFVALQDSDDWSHPDRIAKSVAVLLERPEVMGLTTDWLRMTNEGGLQIKAGGQISHVCCISLVFRRKEVLEGIGFFDSVRIEADMEFIRRIELKFGHQAMKRLRWPLLFGRVRSDSLTGNDEFGITRTGFSPTRVQYQAAQALYHTEIREGRSPVISFPLAERLFAAPDIMLPCKGASKIGNSSDSDEAGVVDAQNIKMQDA